MLGFDYFLLEVAMDFNFSKDKNISKATSNVTFMLCNEDRDDLKKYVTQESMTSAFGPALQDDLGWYFEGPYGSIVGVTFQDNTLWLRGRNLFRRSDVTSEEVVSMFVDHILREVNNALNKPTNHVRR